VCAEDDLRQGAILLDPIIFCVGDMCRGGLPAQPCSALVLAATAPFVSGPQIGSFVSVGVEFQLLFPVRQPYEELTPGDADSS